MATELSAAIKLYLESRGFTTGVHKAERGLRGFARGARSEIGALGRSLRSMRGQLATLGVGIGLFNVARGSANLTLQLTRIQHVAGATTGQIHGLRHALFKLSESTGVDLATLRAGFGDLVQAGLDWKSSLATIGSINKAVAVTGSNAKTLAGSLVTAANVFGFDLARGGEAMKLLNQMYYAANKGRVELEDISGVFGKIGLNAKRAGFSYTQTLAFAEALSGTQANADVLGTVADATLRIFTQARTMKAAAKASGVSFFDKSGARRNPLAVLGDIRKQFKALKTDAAKQRYLTRLFPQADIRMLRGAQAFLSGDALGKAIDINKHMADAAGLIQRQVPGSIADAVHQAERLKVTLREAADSFAQPFNKHFADAVQYLINPKDKGGLGLSGTDLFGLGAVGLGGAYLAKRFGGKALSKLGGGILGTAAGVAEGKALQAATGVAPVFVTNWPANMTSIPGLPGRRGGLPNIPGLPDLSRAGRRASKLARLGRFAGKAGRVGGAAALGYGIGTLINDHVIKNTWLDRLLNKAFGNDEAVKAIDATNRAARLHAELMKRIAQKEAESHGRIDININSDGTISVKRLESSKNVELNVGHTMRLP